MEEQKLVRRKSKALNSSNRKQLAEICMELGGFYNKKSQYDEALSEYKQSARIYYELKMELENAQANRMVGEVYMFLAEFEKALKHEEIYLAIAKKLNNKVEEQRALATLGRAYLLQGQSLDDSNISTQLSTFKSAEKSFMRSLTLCESLKGKVSNQELMDMKGRLLLNLGVISEQLGSFDKAINFIQKAVVICRNQDLYDLLTQCYITEGLLHSSKHDDHAKAISCYNLALDTANRLESKVSKQCQILLLKSEALCKISDFQSAKNVLLKAWKMKTPNEDERHDIEEMLKTVAALCYTEDLLITTNSNDHKAMKKLYEKMGDGACILKNYKKAIYFYLKMLDNAEKCGDAGRELIPTYISLYQTYKDLKEFDKALEYNRKEYEIVESIPKEAFSTLISMGEISLLANKPYAEIEMIYEEAKKQAIKTCDRKLELNCLKSLLKVQEHFCLADLIKNTKEEIALLFELFQISDESADELSGDNETPNIGHDICLENLTDISDDEDNEKVVRKRGKTFSIKKNAKGETQLHQACISGNSLLVTRLLSQGHPVNIRDNAGWLPIHEACIHGYKEIVETLIKSGAHINDRGGAQCDGITPICDAASNGHLEIVELLLDNGASPVIKTDHGKTPLDTLLKWRESTSISPSDHIFYETLCGRMQKSLEKTGDTTHQSNTFSRNMYRDVYNETKKKAVDESEFYDLSNSQHMPNVQNSFNESRNQSNKSFSSKGRRVINDDTSNSSVDSEICEPLPQTSTTAVKEYKKVINIFRNKHTDKSCDDQELVKNKKKAAILSQNEVGEDWLDDDLVLFSKKRRKQSIEDPHPAKRKSADLKKSPFKNNAMLQSEYVGVINNSDDDSSSSDVSISTVQNLENINQTNMSDQVGIFRTNSNKMKKKYKRQTSLLRIGFSKEKSDQASIPLISTRQFDEEPDSTTENNKNYNSKVSYIQSSNTADLRINTEQPNANISQVPLPPITIRVRIQEKMLLIPVPSEKINSLTVDWLVKETCRRFYNIEGIQPTLNLSTSDGALLADEDPLSIIIGSSELVANITNWNLPSLGKRYVECCSQFELDVDDHIKYLLEKSQATHILSFSGLNLDIYYSKSIFKALNHQTNLRRIILSHNNIGNDGVMLLSQSLPTLIHIEELDLSGNFIDSDGIRHIVAIFEKTNKPICQYLQSLNLSYNFLSGLGFNYVVKLTKYIKFKSLNLRHGDIDCRTTDVAETSINLQYLEHLDISSNVFEEGVLSWMLEYINKSSLISLQIEKLNISYFVNTLFNSEAFQSLNEINLSRCNIKDSDILRMSRASSKCGKLEKIFLQYNSELSFLSLKELLSHETLLHIDLEGCMSILKYLDDSDFQSNFFVGEKKNNIEYLKISPENLEGNKYVDFLTTMWSERWKEKAVIIQNLNIKIFSKK